MKVDIHSIKGKSKEDDMKILNTSKKHIEMTIDEYGRIFNEGGQYIADGKIVEPGAGVGAKNHGGKREGAGRPATGRKKKNYYVTDDEDTKIRELIEKMRGENIMYKVETIDYLNGEYLPGTEKEIYSGKGRDEARAAFDKFVETESITAIGSKLEDDGRWEIIWEK